MEGGDRLPRKFWWAGAPIKGGLTIRKSRQRGKVAKNLAACQEYM